MKYLFLLILILLLLRYTGAGQNVYDPITPSSLNIKFLEHLTKLQIDSVRKSYGLNPLINNPILYDAATDHAQYLTEKNSLGHFQPENKNKKTPQNRIEYYGAKDIGAGENAIQIYVNVNTTYKHDKHAPPHIVRTYKEAAFEMMIGWINSPGHFANIITKDYVLSGMAIDFDSLNNCLRGVQVFGKLMYPKGFIYTTDRIKFPYENLNMDSLIKVSSKIKSKVHKHHAWKLKNPLKKKDIDRCKVCDQLFKDSEDCYPVISDDSMYYFFENRSLLEQVLNKKKDGIAIEIIPFRYYSCDNDLYYTLPGRRNNLCIFNGKVPQPVYKKDLESKIRTLKENSSSPQAAKNNVLINMGELPDSLKNQMYDINLVLIKKRKVCNILRMSSVCGELYDYIPGNFPNDCDFKSKKALPKVKQDTVTLSVYFEKNKWDYDVSQLEPALNIIKNNNYEILRAVLNSFASVEGTEELNENLYNNRAKAIVSKFEEQQDSAITMKITMQENWPLFFKQIRGTKWERFGSLDTLAIRNEVNKPEISAEMEPLLKKQRYTYVKLIARYKISEQNIDSLIMSEFNDLFDKLNKKFIKTSPLNLNNESKKDIARMEELVMYLLNRRITGKLKDNSFLTMEIPMNAAFAGLHFYRNYYNYSMSLISETQYFKNLAEIIDTKTKNIPANYHYIAFLINNVQDEYYKNLLTSDYIKYFTELLSSEDFDKEKLSQLQLLYHFYVCKESLFSAKAKKAGPSLSYIYNYYNPKTIPDSVRYAIASHFVAFRKFDYAKKMIEPLVFRETPYSDAYVLYLHLHYTGQIPLNNTEYFEEIMKASDFLSEKEWCGLFLEKCRITFQLMDYEPLRNLFCIKCMKDKQ